MPKITKKKREKTADFSKAKLKLGKGKKVPTNSTNTSFKARSIALPGQQPLDRALAAQILDENGQSRSDPALPPTTGKGLTLDEVLVLLRHPNGGVRKDNLSSLKEILVVGVEKGISMGKREGEVGKVVRALGGLVSDEDGAVRKALLGFLSWYLPLLPNSTLTPHLPLLLLQTSSALSHIFPDIRLDACRLVHFLLDQVPAHVVGSWPQSIGEGPSSSKQTLDSGSGAGSNILEGLRLAVGLGGEKGSSSQMGFRITPASKLVTLRTLLAFISRALGRSTPEVANNFDETNIFGEWSKSLPRPHGKGKLVRSVVEMSANLKDEGWIFDMSDWGVNLGGSTEWEIGRIHSGNTENEASTQEVLSQLYLTLQPLLLSTFLESAPTAFSPTTSAASSSEDVPLALCSISAAITHVLAEFILSSSCHTPSTKLVRSGVSDFLRRMAAWFPFRASQARQSSSSIEPEFALSLSYASIAVLLAPRPVELSSPARDGEATGRQQQVKAVESAWKRMRQDDKPSSDVGRQKGKGRSGAENWALNEVADWVVNVLALQTDALAPTLAPAAYFALLPILWALLVQPRDLAISPPTDIPEKIGKALLQHLDRQSSSSAIKKSGDAFLFRIMLIHEDRYPTFPFLIPTSSAVRPLLQNWFESLPKALWELGAKDEKASEAILRFLLTTGLKGAGAIEEPYSLLGAPSFTIISTRLGPFYHLTHSIKGSVPGPWTRLSSDSLKKLSLEVAKVWSEWSEGSLQSAVSLAVGSGQWREYWDRSLS